MALPPIMASRSTYLRGGFGGFHGRALRKDDTLTLNADLQDHNLDELADKLWQIKIYLPAILGMNPRPAIRAVRGAHAALFTDDRSEEHTSELQSLMRISYAVFCLKKKKT